MASALVIIAANTVPFAMLFIRHEKSPDANLLRHEEHRWMNRGTECPSLLMLAGERRVVQSLWSAVEAAGYPLTAAEDEAAVRALLAERDIALALCVIGGYPASTQLLAQIVSLRVTLPVIALSERPRVEEAVEAMRLGAIDYRCAGDFVRSTRDSLERYLAVRRAGAVHEVIGRDPATLDALALVERVAPTSLSVLLTGESGSGKEVFARAIHARSPRRDQPFVAVNCAAIPDNLLEATLFGFEKGAFTGAQAAQPGKFEQAHGGTLLLDEITEMPQNLQAKLLRALQEREVERVGGRSPVAVDVRVIATSNRDVRDAVAQGAFREDLYYRLEVFPVRVPALRERPADIVPLARHFGAIMAGEAGRAAPEFSERALACLQAYAWPGNVRELQNIVQRAVLLAPGSRVEEEHLGLRLTASGAERVVAGAGRSSASPSAAGALPRVCGGEEAGAEEGSRRGMLVDMKSLERAHIMETLAAVNGSRKRAVELLGISERTLRHKLRQYRLNYGGQRRGSI
jgi:two-component system, response regulator FlrC